MEPQLSLSAAGSRWEPADYTWIRSRRDRSESRPQIRPERVAAFVLQLGAEDAPAHTETETAVTFPLRFVEELVRGRFLRKGSMGLLVFAQVDGHGGQQAWLEQDDRGIGFAAGCAAAASIHVQQHGALLIVGLRTVGATREIPRHAEVPAESFVIRNALVHFDFQ